MEEKSNNVRPVVIAVVVTAVVVASGMYYFPRLMYKSDLEEMPRIVPELEVKKIPAPHKSLVRYYANRRSGFNKELSSESVGNNPTKLRFKEVGKVNIACPKNADGPCGGDLLILSKEALHTGNQAFYLAQEGGARYDYFGPFTDDLTRLVAESKTIESIPESY